MAIVKMKRIEILAMLSDSKSIVDLVQQQGCIELFDCKTESNELYKVSASGAAGQFDKFSGIVKSAVEILDMHAKTKGGLLAGFAPRPELTVSEYYKKSQEADTILSKCYGVNALYKEIQDLRVSIVRNEVSIDQLTPWLSLDIPSSFSGTDMTAAFIGSMEGTFDREAVLTKLAEINPELEAEIEIISTERVQTCLVAVCHKEDAKELEQALRSLGFSASADPVKKLPAERIEELRNRNEALKAEITEKEEKIAAYSEYREDMKFLEDYLTVRTDKYRALDKISMSDNIFVLSGYCPENKVEMLKEKLESIFDVAISVTEPDYEAEDVPVLVENGTMGSTMEAVTNMYSTPSHFDIDPNKIMTVFYFALFGMMLGDAGYGLIIVIACLFVKFKYRLEPQKAKTVNYGLFCGIGTTVWGILLNGWFGDLPHYIANGFKLGNKVDLITANHLYWFNPLQHTTRFLLLAFFIGILHLALGICLNLYKNIKQHNTFAGIVENVPILMILVGVLPLINSQIGGSALSENPPTKMIDDWIKAGSGVMYGFLAAGAILVVLGPMIIAVKERKSFGKILGGLGGGLYGLYNAASGYLGDILSYARLLALGLCTGVIASVINQLAAMPGNIILFVVIALFGHTVNAAINLIGTYVHTNRLQYVEFFSKFYEGGGTPFRPLNVNSKSFKFKEETKSC